MSVNGTDRKSRVRQAGSIGEWANAAWALPHQLGANLDLRLEHELQTAIVRRQRLAPPRVLQFLTVSAMACQQRPLGCCRARREVPVVLSLKGIGAASASRIPLRTRARGGFESRIRLAPVIILQRETIHGGRAGCPNATQPEPFTVSPTFIRPQTGNWQAACGIWLNRYSFTLPGRTFCGHLAWG